MRISIFGFGDFGQLITRYLVNHAEVLVYDRGQEKTKLITELGAKPVDLEQAASTEVIILATTLDALESTLGSIAPFVKPGTLVADVTSVKVKPAEMMQRLLPNNVQILATHPLFGPISAAESLADHKIVIDPIRVDNQEAIEEFLVSLGLQIVHMTCDEHDREMAWVHALTFFVGRGLLNIDPPKSNLNTNYYDELMDIVNIERTHSEQLFKTIQLGNPYAQEMRQRLLASLNDLEQELEV